MPKRSAIERLRDVGLVRVHRLALDEQTLHRVERRELVVPGLERAHFGLDAEQRRDEVFEMRPERDQELRLGLALQRIRVGARRGEARRKYRIRRLQMVDESTVDTRRPVALIEIGENEPVGERQ